MPFVNAQGGRLHYEVHDLASPWVANPVTIVFHHGIAENLHVWHEWLPHFCARYRMVVFDARGCGQSTSPAQGHDWSLEQFAGDVLDVAQAAGANRFHFIGESLGGTVGLYLAAKLGDRLLSLTASNCAAHDGMLQHVAGWRNVIGKHGQRTWAERMMAQRFHPNTLPQAQYDWLLEQYATCSASTVLAQAGLLAEADLTAQLGAIRVPTLLLCPDAGSFAPAAHAAEMQSLIPGAELQVFAHARDGMLLSHAASCAQTVAAFLARNTPRAKSDFPAVI